MTEPISEHEYHRKFDRLSASGAKVLLQTSPAQFYYDLTHPKPKPAYDLGHVVHELILGIGGGIVEVQADSWRTNAAKAARDEARAEHKVALLTADYVEAKAMADAVARHRKAAELLAKGEAERSLFWDCPVTGCPMRARPDWINPSFGLVDVKTTTDAHLEPFGRACGDYGYFIQNAIYAEGAVCTEITSDVPRFAFIAVSKKPPYIVTVSQLPIEDVDLGYELGLEAKRTFMACNETGVWPGPDDNVIHQISIPKWIHRKAS